MGVKEDSVGRSDVHLMPIDKLVVIDCDDYRYDTSINENVSDLVNLIKENGYDKTCPVTVFRSPTTGLYEVQDGRCRFRAMQTLVAQGFEIKAVIPCILETKSSSREDRLIKSLNRNSGRRATVIEQARLFGWLKGCGLSADQICVKVGLSKTRVTDILLLGEVSEPVKVQIAQARVSADIVISMLKDGVPGADIESQVLGAVELSNGKRAVAGSVLKGKLAEKKEVERKQVTGRKTYREALELTLSSVEDAISSINANELDIALATLENLKKELG